MSEKRKPVICPWCGGEMERRQGRDVFHGTHYYYECSICESKAPIAYGENGAYAAATQRPPVDENTSDGYHTFKELYHHRAVLFAALIAQMPEKAWKSKQHSDGTMFDGMFIVGIETPDGQATYHYDIDPYWGLFRCRELDHAPEWDGHTPAQAIERIEQMTVPPPNRPLTLAEIKNRDDFDAIWWVRKNDNQTFVFAVYEFKGMTSEFSAEMWAFAAKPTPADIEAARKERNG